MRTFDKSGLYPYESEILDSEYTKSDPNGGYDGLVGLIDASRILGYHYMKTDIDICLRIVYKDGDESKTVSTFPVFQYKWKTYITT